MSAFLVPWQLINTPMSKRQFTGKQMDELRKNKNVLRCSGKSITYTKDFKLYAINLYDQGQTSSEIFRGAGFDLNVVGRGQPKDCMNRWRKIFRTKGMHGLVEQRGKNGRAGRPKTKGVTEADRIKRLEAEVAYLKAENSFLAKLRAQRAESNSGQHRNISS